MRPDKLKRNAIIEAVLAAGLDANEFIFDFDDARSLITHLPSESYFLLEGNPGHYTSTMAVGDGLPQPSTSYTWPTVDERIQRWAREVKRDVETPDRWAELQRARETLTGARYDAVENTPFTPDEQAEIAEQLGQIKELVKETYSLSASQMLVMETRLDEVRVAAGRVGRKDLRLLFLGLMFEVIAMDLLPREVVTHIVTLAFHGLDYLLGGGGSPPQITSPRQ